ncbi:protein FAR1-RELATED SEQUENCE 6-like [Chenopodium quinoa]|uniref:protein FAR1-RELATED SEQUENCE 6-like n=1 Tax=Chenopodium quinoa TaxID=63459 RepID=UPI000B792679|nr:protein FAR1-RELATED SEQUENCE 6-like [Chenopodium quinoa]
MGNKQPGAILTDQAAAMRKPLEQVMPNARHRWCIWHILKKLPDKLGKCEGYHDFKSPLKTLIYESFTVGEFERRWNELLSEYNLLDNDWLSELYEERHMWVPAFMKEHFWAGMKTTQRVESINSFFDGFVNRKTKLYEFPDKYKRAMERRVKAEKEADARCRKYLRRLVSGFYIEEFFQKIYTDTKFQEIQTDCTRLMHCSGREERVLDDNLIQYILEDRVWIIPERKSEEVITDRRRFYCVIFNTVTKDVSCDCRKFETFGILCRHVIRVYDQNLVVDIPSKYVLQRWRKDVARKHTRVKVSYHDPTDNATYQSHNKLMQEFDPICEITSSIPADKETFDLVVNSLKRIHLEVQQSREKYLENQPSLPTLPRTMLPPSEIGSNNPMSCPTPNSVSKPVVFKDPVSRKKPRGRPKGRPKSLAETGYKKKPATAKGEHNIKTVAGSDVPTKLPAKRKKTEISRNQNTIDDYYEYVGDVAAYDYPADVGAHDDILQRNGVDWSFTSEAF